VLNTQQQYAITTTKHASIRSFDCSSSFVCVHQPIFYIFASALFWKAFIHV